MDKDIISEELCLKKFFQQKLWSWNYIEVTVHIFYTKMPSVVHFNNGKWLILWYVNFTPI